MPHDNTVVEQSTSGSECGESVTGIKPENTTTQQEKTGKSAQERTSTPRRATRSQEHKEWVDPQLVQSHGQRNFKQLIKSVAGKVLFATPVNQEIVKNERSAECEKSENVG